MRIARWRRSGSKRYTFPTRLGWSNSTSGTLAIRDLSSPCIVALISTDTSIVNIMCKYNFPLHTLPPYICLLIFGKADSNQLYQYNQYGDVLVSAILL